jgi:hypothetical protein
MNTRSYQQAFERIRADYLEMPGMRLTPQQVQRLSGLDHTLCRLILDDLVRANFLRMGMDGNYARCADGEPSRLRMEKAERTTNTALTVSRRAS